MSLNRKSQDHETHIAALVGWVALLAAAFLVAPYLYALNDLVQWR